MAYNQKFGPSRKGAKHGKDMISRIMSGADTAPSPLYNSVQYLKGMSGAMNGQKGMDGYSYGVPAEKLKGIQGSEGMSRYSQEEKAMSRKSKGQDALDGIAGGMSRHTAEHSTKEYMDRKDVAIKKSKAEDGLSRHKAGHQGYNDKLDESLGSKDGKQSTKKQSMKSRRDESEGMEKSKGKRKFSSDRGMDKEPGKTKLTAKQLKKYQDLKKADKLRIAGEKRIAAAAKRQKLKKGK